MHWHNTADAISGIVIITPTACAWAVNVLLS